MRRLLWLLLLFFPATPSPADTASGDAAVAGRDERARSLAVLFVGNSLTYTNDMPSMLERLLVDSGFEARIETLAYPNYGLEDHWRRRETRKAIHSGGWDFVVLQQGPSATEGRPSLLTYSKKFARLVRKHGAEPALFMVWPSKSRFGDFDGVADSYRTAAESVSGVLLPVGEAWREAWTLDPELAFYGADGFHPSGAGSLLAALVIYQGLTGIDPAMTLHVPGEDSQARTFRRLAEAASRANLSR